MRLHACHIENFGKLHDFDITFPEELTVIRRENGWGKSTLATFIKAMLYGLDGDRRHGLDENERKRYKPWQGGVFGGRMEFETNGRKYTVTRTFGDTAAKDTFELRDSETNLISHDYSERLGEELFRINSASFCRSIFIGQSDCRTSSTDDIHARIGNLSDNTDDMNSFESAEARLTRQINRLNPKRTTGSLYALGEEIAVLRRRVAEGNGLSEKIAACENEIARKESERRAVITAKAEAEQKQKQAIRLQQLSLQRREWDRLKNALADTQGALDRAKEKFPGGIPDDPSVREVLRSAVGIKSAECLMASFQLSADEEETLGRLQAKWQGHPPSPDAIDLHLHEEQELRQILGKYGRLRPTADERTRLDRLLADFSDDDISPSELTEAWNERCSRKNALSSKRAAFHAVDTAYHKSLSSSRRRSALAAVLGVALIILGVALFIRYSNPWYFCVSVTGFLFLAGGIFFAVILHMQQPPEQLQRLQSEIEADGEFIGATDDTVVRYLEAHGLKFNERFVLTMLQELCGDRRDLDALVNKADVAEHYLSGSDYIQLDKSVRDFLIGYGIIPDDDKMSEQLFELKETVSEYGSLTGKKEKFDNAQEKYLSLSRQAKEFLASFGLSDRPDLQEALERVRDDLAAYNTSHRQYILAKNELRVFENGSDLAALEGADNIAVPSLEEAAEEIRRCSDEIENLSAALLSLCQQRDDLQRQLTEWESDRCDLTAKTLRQSSDRLKYDRLVKAKELLRRAKESMTARYIRPVSDGFMRYYRLIEELPEDRYRIDADIRMTVSEFGQQREIDALSAGYRDLTGVCLRLALADAMYRGEKPVLIMDDPFTNLDDDKVAASRELLRAVSESYQVIYFTCSSSRSAGGASGQWVKKQN